MRIDEAISLLKQYIDYDNPDVPDFYTMEEACEVVIKSLEQQPTDAVSRQAVLDTIGNVPDHDDGMVWEALFHAQRDVALLSPVTAHQKMGRWIMSDDGLYRPICNNCGAHPWKGYIPTVEEATEVFKYCPNCGAKMESEED